MSEFRASKLRLVQAGHGGPWVDVDGVLAVTVTPPDDDEYVAIRATDLVGKELRRTDDLGSATARLDHGFVVIEYPGLGPFHRTLIREEAWVRVKRR